MATTFRDIMVKNSVLWNGVWGRVRAKPSGKASGLAAAKARLIRTNPANNSIILPATPVRASPILNSPRSCAFGSARRRPNRETNGVMEEETVLQKAAKSVRKSTKFLTKPPPESYSERALGIEKPISSPSFKVHRQAPSRTAMADFHSNIFSYFRGGSETEKDRVRQLENNTTKALVNTLEHCSPHVSARFLEWLGIPSPGKVKFVQQKATIGDERIAKKKTKLLLAINRVEEGREPSNLRPVADSTVRRQLP